MPDAPQPPAVRRPLPRWLGDAARALEPLWIGATAALFVIWGYDLIPHGIRMLGHSGQMETIEWAVYMSLLAAFPATCIIVALVLPRLFKGEAATIVKAFAVVVAIALGLIYIFDGRLLLAALAIVPAIATALMAPGASLSAARVENARATGQIVEAQWRASTHQSSWRPNQSW